MSVVGKNSFFHHCGIYSFIPFIERAHFTRPDLFSFSSTTLSCLFRAILGEGSSKPHTNWCSLPLLQDYTWENHGFSLVNRLYSDIGHLLDEKFRMVYNLTYNTMASHEDVDTTMLRRALFNYVHCMYGIR